MAKRVAIVGGGITGLAAAYALERGTDAEIDLYEASNRLGGKLDTNSADGFLIERGPDCFFSRKPGALEMVRELGLEDELIEPEAKAFQMLVGGRLHPVPGGLVTLTYSQPDAVHEATFLSDAAKARVIEEANQPRGTTDDESIRSFFDRRFGAELTRLVAEPLLAGTHSGDPERLSMRALYPGYFDLERKHGSLAAGMPDAPKPGPKKPSFLSFRGGMKTLADALAASLSRTRVHLNALVAEMPQANRTLLAVPANHAARLLPGIGLESIPHGSTTIVTLAFRREDVAHALDGTGFLVPPTEPFPVTGATWSSAKWPGRAPEGTVLMRVFARGIEADEKTALDALCPLLGLGEPLFSRIDRWIEAQPQYEVGHLDKIAAIESGLPQGVYVAGTSYRGVGIPDCLRQGRDAARRIAETL